MSEQKQAKEMSLQRNFRRKRVTLEDIAQELGISSATVSRALTTRPGSPINPATRQKVLKVASELGYYPNLMARAVARRKTGVLGLIGNMVIEPHNDPHNAGIVQNIMTEAHRHGYQVMVELSAALPSKDPLDDQRMQIQQMISWGVDGLLIHTRDRSLQSNLIRDLVGDALPVVVFSYPVEGVSSVVLDRVTGTYMAAEHLIRLGYRRIVFVDQDVSFPSTAKWEGYLRATQSYDLVPERIFSGGTTLEAYYQSGIRIGRMLDPPRALVCPGDFMALGICWGLKAVGVRVPEDVAIVGFGNIEIGAYCEPHLTTVDHPVKDICQKAIQLLMDLINGETEVRQLTVQPHLIVRRSCGAGCDNPGLRSAAI